jgi:hypothetical protein
MCVGKCLDDHRYNKVVTFLFIVMPGIWRGMYTIPWFRSVKSLEV